MPQPPFESRFDPTNPSLTNTHFRHEVYETLKLVFPHEEDKKLHFVALSITGLLYDRIRALEDGVLNTVHDYFSNNRK